MIVLAYCAVIVASGVVACGLTWGFMVWFLVKYDLRRWFESEALFASNVIGVAFFVFTFVLAVQFGLWLVF